MTPRERVYLALQFQDTDIVPYHMRFTSTARKKMAAHFGDEDFESKIGNHLALISHRNSGLIEIKPGYVRDMWGVIWNRTIDKDIGVVDSPVLPEPTLAGWEPPDPKSAAVFDSYPDYIESNRDRFRMPSLGFSLFERAWSLRGMDRLLVDMVDSPAFVRDLLDRIMEFQLETIDKVLEYDVDGIFFGDDWGSQTGLIMGPGLWREFIKPRVAKLYERVQRAGKYVAIHSCGDVRMILPDLVEIGLNIFNPFQPEVMDIFETKKCYQGRLAFYGGISVQRLLPHGTPDDVRREVKVLLWELGKGGGYIASPSHDVTPDSPPENIAALIEVLRGQR